MVMFLIIYSERYPAFSSANVHTHTYQELISIY
ncbi:MAG: hypothetical protein ACI83D_000370 [Planctomycetota bacterium]|jgi:hypothetical protein